MNVTPEEQKALEQIAASQAAGGDPFGDMDNDAAASAGT